MPEINSSPLRVSIQPKEPPHSVFFLCCLMTSIVILTHVPAKGQILYPPLHKTRAYSIFLAIFGSWCFGCFFLQKMVFFNQCLFSGRKIGGEGSNIFHTTRNVSYSFPLKVSHKICIFRGKDVGTENPKNIDAFLSDLVLRSLKQRLLNFCPRIWDL